MKSVNKKLVLAASALPVVAMSLVSAEEVSCDGSLVPQICRIFAGSGGFSVSGLLYGIFGVIIAALVLFILFQIVKAVFQWVGKAGDEKARSAAIKSITDAVIAGIVLIVAVLVVIIGANLLNINTPAPYACIAGNVTGNVTNRGTLKPSSNANANKEIPDVSAYEGTGSNNAWNTFSGSSVDSDVVSALKKVRCLSTAGANANSEYGSPYTVVARIALTTK